MKKEFRIEKLEVKIGGASISIYYFLMNIDYWDFCGEDI